MQDFNFFVVVSDLRFPVVSTGTGSRRKASATSLRIRLLRKKKMKNELANLINLATSLDDSRGGTMGD